MQVSTPQFTAAKLALPALAIAVICAALAGWLAFSDNPYSGSMSALMRLPFSMAMCTLVCIAAQSLLEINQRVLAILLAGGVAFVVTMTIAAWVADLPPPFGLILFSASHAAELATDGTWFPNIEGVLAALPIAIGSVATLWLAMNVGQPIGRPLGWATGWILLLAPITNILMVAASWLGVPTTFTASKQLAHLSPLIMLMSLAIALYGFSLVVSRHTRVASKIDAGARLRAIAVVLSVTATLVLWHSVRIAEIRQLRTDINSALLDVESDLDEGSTAMARVPNRLADHWRNLNWHIPDALFRSDAAVLLHDYPAVSAILITDTNGNILNGARRDLPFDADPDEKDAVVSVDIHNLPTELTNDVNSRAFAQQAIAQNKHLTNQPKPFSNGVQLFVAAEPILDANSRPLGTLLLVFRRDIKLQSILKNTAPDFEIRVLLDNGPIYHRALADRGSTTAQQYRVTRRLTIGASDYIVEITPDTKILARNLTWTPALVLVSTWASLLLLIFALHNERRAHALLQDRERVLNQSLDLICTLDANGRILTMNDASRRMLGYEPADLCGRLLLDHVHAQDRQSVAAEWLNKDFETPARTRATRFVRFDGTLVFLQGVARWAHDEQLLYFTIRDVTDHHTLDLARQHAAKTLHIGVEQAGCVVYEFVPQTQSIEWVGALQALTGYEPHEFAARGWEGWLRAIHPDDREHAKQTLQRCLETKQAHSIDYRLQRRDGTYVPVLDRGRHITNEDQTESRMIGALIDLTLIRQQEHALRRSEERYRIIATQVGSVIMERESATGRVEAHGPVEKIFGYTKAQIESRPVQERDVMVHPDDRDRVYQATSEAARNLSSYYVEYRRRHRGGHYIYISNRGVVLAGADGKPERAVVAITDITARKQAEASLTQSEERFRLAVEQSKQIVYEFSYSDQFEIESKRFAGAIEQLTGYTKEEFAAVHEQSHLILLHPDDLAAARAITAAAINISGSYQIEHRLRRKDGTYVYVENRGAALRNSTGQLIGTVGLLLDISARKLAETDRHRYTAQLHMLADVARKVSTLQSLHELLNYLSRSMRDLVNANAATASVDDATLTEVRVVAVSYAERYGAQHGANHSFGTAELQALLQENTAPVRLSVAEIKADARWSQLTQNDDLQHPLRGWLAIALSTRTGQQIGVLEVSDKTDGDFSDSDAQILSQLAGIASVAIENIRLYATLEERVAARTRELEMSNRELEAFSYSVSHDLRAPLRAIAGFSSILETEHASKLDAGARRYLQRITGGVERMANLIDDLLSLARVSRLDLKHETVDLTALCRSISKRQLERFPNRAIDIKVEPRMRVSADPRLVEVAMENLIENAIKFTGTRDETQIHIGHRVADGKPAFYIRDNGVGFDPQYAANLFGVFQRLHSTSEFPGTGVGLATVQRIIQRHRGRVWAESQIDQGASFYFTFDSEL